MFIVYKNRKTPTRKQEKAMQTAGGCMFILGLFFGSYPLFIVGDPGYWGGMQRISDATGMQEKFWYTIGGFFLIFGLTLCTPLQRLFTIAPIRFIGTISYPLYLIHLQLMGSVMSAIFKGLLGKLSYDAAALTSFLIYIVILIPLSYAGVFLVDRPSITVGRAFENWGRGQCLSPSDPLRSQRLEQKEPNVVVVNVV